MVSYCYDGTTGLGRNLLGKLTYVGNSGSQTQFTGFDAMGRVLSSAQQPGGIVQLRLRCVRRAQQCHIPTWTEGQRFVRCGWVAQPSRWALEWSDYELHLSNESDRVCTARADFECDVQQQYRKKRSCVFAGRMLVLAGSRKREPRR
jgi:hypothetical protein